MFIFFFAIFKKNKWNHIQFLGCGSENHIRFNFLPLFMTKNLQNYIWIILIVKNFNFMYWSYFWALFALCFHYEIFWIRLDGKRLQIMLRLPRLLCLSNYFMESLRLQTWPKFSMKILSGNLRLYHTGSEH